MPAEPASSYQAHEDRLQRLEAAQTELAVKVGEHGTHLKFLTKAVNDGFENTTKSIDNLSEHFDECMKPLGSRLEAISERVGEQGRAIDGFKAVAKKRSDRMIALKKAVIGLVLAGAGVVVKELFTWLVH